MKLGVVSDTHGVWDAALERFFSSCDVVLHAGDIGSLALGRRIEAFRTLIAVHGNIDDSATRAVYPEEQLVELGGVRVYMRHIGGYPRHYRAPMREAIRVHRPGLVICGHSHILRVMYDHEYNHLHINPGAYGKQGVHAVRTAVRFVLEEGAPSALEVLEVKR